MGTQTNYILGIETSCDETGVAIYHEPEGILGNALFSQIALHEKYGGVIPENASRSQLEKITPIMQAALAQANVDLDTIDVIAVTNTPGLSGSLLVGTCFAKALAYAKNKKLIGVNHLEGHIFSSCIENSVAFPHICITASGGHSALYRVDDFGVFTLLGSTLDDAAGEAFDKVAKMLDLPYPGGPVIEKMAAAVNFTDYFKYPRGTVKNYDFSFSGLKTAIMYDLIKRGAYDLTARKYISQDLDLKNQVASSLLVCVSAMFEARIKRALKEHVDVKAVTFVGGVACNKFIRERLREVALAHNKEFYSPSPQYCTDNGAMIAFVGNYKARNNQFSDLNLDIKP